MIARTSIRTRCGALRDLAPHPKVVAIGEIGMDYYWEQVTAPAKVALTAQLAMAIRNRGGR